MPDRFTYLYCLAASPRAPELAGAPAGLPGCGPVRLLDAGRDLWVAAADAPAPRFAPARLEAALADPEWVGRCALGHEQVVEHLLAQTTVVPLRPFTLHSSDARALAAVAARRPAVDAAITAVRGCAEWGLRVRLERRDDGADRAAAPRRAATGTQFLSRKKLAADGARMRARTAAEGARGVHRALARHARDVHLAEAPPAAGLLVEAAYLVPLDRAPAFRAEAEAARRALASRGCLVSLTGPWPPYHFVSEGR